MFSHKRRAFDRTEQARTAIDMKSRQTPLIQTYVSQPEQAVIIDSAKTDSRYTPTADAIHTQVDFGIGNPASQHIGVHTAVGGDSDYPNPGELLSAALASCLDATIRIIANRLGLPLRRLAVSVDASVDVRGTLRVCQQVPTGFQTIDIAVDIEPAVPVADDQIAGLIKAAEQSCVVLQTLMSSPTIELAIHSNDGPGQ
ncbi:MAG: OsmC family protein [Hyphomicrobiaceae bacterium]